MLHWAKTDACYKACSRAKSSYNGGVCGTCRALYFLNQCSMSQGLEHVRPGVTISR